MKHILQYDTDHRQQILHYIHVYCISTNNLQ